MSDFNLGAFQNPPKAARPMVRWWWPGLDVEPAELRREAADLDEGYFGGGEVQAFLDGITPEMRADPACQARLNRYRTPFYFDVIAGVLEEFEKRGLTLDLTSCSGWPTNGVDVPLSQGQKHLYMASVTVEGGGAREVRLPTADDLLEYRATEKLNAPKPPRMGPFRGAEDDSEVLKKTLERVAVSAAKCVGAPVDVVMTHAAQKTGLLEKPVDVSGFVSDGCLKWDFPAGTWQVFCFFAGPNGNTSHMASREDATKPNYIVDHFAKGVIGPYLDRHIGAGGFERHAGKTLRAFFTDSFELSSPWTWTDDFLAEFAARRGYDLRPYLQATSVPGCESMFAKMMGLKTPPMYDFADGVGERIRYDHQLTIADLFDDYFIEAMKDWGDENKLKSRVQCYGHSMDNLKAFGRTHIPETEQLAGNGVVDFLKLVGSAGMLYELPLATSETLVWIRHDYMTTPTKMKVAADKLFVSGVNQLIYHGMPYRHPGMDFPHFYPFHGMFGSFICRDNTLWRQIGGMNRRIARGQFLMQAGPLSCEVAVYYQKLDYVSGTGALEELTSGVLPGFDRSGALSSGYGDPNAPSPEQARGNYDFRLSHILMDAGYDYYHINEECLLRAELIDGALTCGDARFKALVLNGEEKIGIEAAYKLGTLIDAGFPVIFLDRVPSRVPGFLDYRRREAELARIFADARAVAQEAAPDALGAAGILPGIVCEAKDLQHTKRILDAGTLWFVRSSNPAARILTLRLSGARGGLRVLGTQNGEVMRPAYRVTDDGIELELPFVAYGSWFILTGDDLPDATGDAEIRLAFSACEEGAEIVPDGGWRIAAGETELILDALTDWADHPALKSFSGTAEYAARFDVVDPRGKKAIDLGMVGDAAELFLNGVRVGEALTVPFIFDVTGLLKKGENELNVRVTNTLRNGTPGAGAFRGMGGEKELAMSGILGPVKCKSI